MNRKRISALQAEVLVRFMEDSPQMVCGRTDAQFTRADKEREWKELTATLNAIGCAKTTDKWVKTWSDMKVVAKKKLGIYRQEVHRSGSVPQESHLMPSPIDQRIVQLIAPHILSGIPYPIKSMIYAMSDEDKALLRADLNAKFEEDFINSSKDDVIKYDVDFDPVERVVHTIKDEILSEGSLSPSRDYEPDFDIKSDGISSDLELNKKGDLHTCENCGVASFLRSKELRKHYNSCRSKKKSIKLEEQSFEEYINQEVKDKTSDEIKMLSGSESIDNKYVCKVCREKFIDEASLTKHKLLHPKKYVCRTCRKRFYFSSSLSRHMEIHECLEATNNISLQSKKFSRDCGYVESKRFLREKLQKSLQSSRKQVYNCKKCNKEFTSTTLFEEHALSHAITKSEQKKLEAILNSSNKSIERVVTESTSDFQTTKALKKAYVCSFCCQGFLFECNLKIHQRLHGNEKFHCRLCNKTYPSEKHLKNHESLHEKGKIYTCIVCDKNFNNKTHLVDHLRTHKCNKIFECSLCYKGFYSDNKLDEHKQFHIKGTFTCDVCKKICRNKMILIKHIKSHFKVSKVEKHPCDLCDQILGSLALLNKHRNTVHCGLKRLKCETCEKVFTNVPDLEKHMSSHTDVKNYSCKECAKPFALKMALEAHEAIHGDDNVTKFPCQVCGKTFPLKAALKLHEAIHGGIRFTCEICGKGSKTIQIHKKHLETHVVHGKMHTCQICNKSYSQIHLLRAHRKRHSDQRPHSCGQCEWTFKTRGALKTHFMRKHSKDRPHICAVCGEGFSLPSLLKYHEYRHTGKPHTCHFCNKSFTRNYILKLHLTIHTGDMPFSCGICNKKFTRRFRLKRHEQTHNVNKDIVQKDEGVERDIKQMVGFEKGTVLGNANDSYVSAEDFDKRKRFELWQDKTALND